MRNLTLALSIVLVVLLGFAALFWLGGTLSAHVLIQTAPAADYPAAYGSIRALLDSDSAPQRFDEIALPEAPEGYTLVDVNVSLTNRGLFPAEWLDMRVVPAEGDIAVYALTGEGSNIDARGVGQVDLKIITTAPPDAQREIVIQYYVHGMKREITVR